MKKLTFILTALALTLGFSQCKKTETPTADEGVRITLTAGYGGEKTGFTPSTGAFVWTSGSTEYIYVGGSNHTDCLGVLSGTGTGTGSMTFSGTLTTTPDENETLHFFYLGFGAQRTGTALTTLDFSNQDGTLDNVTNWHIAMGNGSYSSSTINYATTLEMKMAIAYFDVSGFQNASNTAETVYLHGDEVYTTATIDYQTGTITGETKGYLNMGTANAGKYVALIPSTTEQTTLKFDSDSKTGTMTFNRGIQAKKYYSNDVAALNVTANALLEGAIPGLFSVSATKMVRFSQGNLQYIGSASTPYWQFADKQWETLGNNGQGSTNQKVDRDLFGWGTSGWNNENTYYNPWDTDNRTSSSYDYGPRGDHDLTDAYANADWGVYNSISNGGNQANQWRTLTQPEWAYVFNTRTTSSGIRYARANVNNVNGVILLPDDWSASYYSLSNTNQNGASFGSNEISSTQWSTLEQHGAVFLPAAGLRNGTSVGSVGSLGFYWSASYSRGNCAYCVEIRNSILNLSDGNIGRCNGHSVRLVRSAQ